MLSSLIDQGIVPKDSVENMPEGEKGSGTDRSMQDVLDFDERLRRELRYMGILQEDNASRIVPSQKYFSYRVRLLTQYFSVFSRSTGTLEKMMRFAPS